jgi:hypothetical protein
MVQMVFVHGVTVRQTASYDADLKARDKRFSDQAFAGKVKIYNPYWGLHGAPAKFKAIPKFEAPAVMLGVGGAPAGNLLVDAAKQDFAAVVASLSVAATEEAPTPADHDKAVAFWSAAARLAELDPRPAWLTPLLTDQAFLSELKVQVQALEPTLDVALGLFDPVVNAAKKLVGGVSNLVNSPFGKIGREVISPQVAIFTGDVFKYLKSGKARDDIRAVVAADVVAAAKAAKAGNEPLVLAGHSMGAVILYDMLSDPAAVAGIEAGLGHSLKVDLFLSVGSQIAIFEENKVFASSNPAQAGLTARPACVERWWNVWDRMDVLSFLTAPVFKDVQDFAVDTIAGVADAHGAYFSSAVFYERLAKRLKTAGLV